MAPSEKKTDLNGQAVGLMIEQLKEKPNYLGVVKAAVNQLQEIEDTLNDLLVNRAIDTATGEQLDKLGTIVGELREGRNDEDYRGALRLRVFINASQGDPETIISATAWITDSSFVSLTEQHPAGIILSFNGNVPDNLLSSLNEISPAGILEISLISGLGEAPNDLLQLVDVNASGEIVWTPPDLGYSRLIETVGSNQGIISQQLTIDAGVEYDFKFLLYIESGSVNYKSSNAKFSYNNTVSTKNRWLEIEFSEVAALSGPNRIIINGVASGARFYVGLVSMKKTLSDDEIVYDSDMSKGDGWASNGLPSINQQSEIVVPEDTLLGFDYGFELVTDTGDRIVFNDGDAPLLITYDITNHIAGYGGKVGEGY